MRVLYRRARGDGLRGTMRWVPTAATLANGAAGFLACACVAMGLPEYAALLILVGVILDSIDGMLARSLRAESEMGAELDSFSDIVSFGVAPALLAGSMVPIPARGLAWLLIAAYPLCAAWRLARYNLRHASGEEGEGIFVGLPSTGAGAALATATLMYMRLAELGVSLDAAFFPYIALLLASLMVSRLPYAHAAALIGRLSPTTAGLVAVLFVVGSVAWHYEFTFGLLMWFYVLSAPMVAARHKLASVPRPGS